MMERISEVAHLGEADALLHDLTFDMSTVSYDAKAGVVALFLYPSKKTHDLQSSKTRLRRITVERGFALNISNVMSYALHDPQGLVEHSYARFQWSDPQTLSLLSNFPGSIQMDVSKLNIQIEEQPIP